jgi:hypothetical protein
MTATILLLGVLFGSLGLGYWIYGKREQKAMPLLAGVALMVFPYFLSQAWEIIVIGLVLAAIPFLIRI